MKKVFMFSVSIIMCVVLFSNSLVVLLEDSSLPCEVFVNDLSVGEVKDSIVLNSLEEGSYKVSMFSGALLDSTIEESNLTGNDKKARKLGQEKMNEAVKLGTESIFVAKTGEYRVTLKNKQVNSLLNPKKSSSPWACCCIGGAGGGCIVVGGTLLLAGLLGWGIYMLITQGLPDLD